MSGGAIEFLSFFKFFFNFYLFLSFLTCVVLLLSAIALLLGRTLLTPIRVSLVRKLITLPQHHNIIKHNLNLLLPKSPPRNRDAEGAYFPFEESYREAEGGE